VQEATAPAAAPGPAQATAVAGRGFFQNLAGVLFSPREEFGHILARPRFWVPLVAWMVLGMAFTAFWMQKVDPREFMRNEIINSGRADKIPAGQMEQVLDQQAGFFKPISWISAFVAAPIITFMIAGVFLFVFRFFYGGDVTYAQSLAIVAWTFFSLALVTTPVVALVMGLKGDWNINPQEALQASGAVFLDRTTTSKPLYTLAASLDLFTFWVLWLFSTGYAVATRRTTGSAAAGVLTVWAIFVLCKVALAAIF
jgi:hypothetical protein